MNSIYKRLETYHCNVEGETVFPELPSLANLSYLAFSYSSKAFYFRDGSAEKAFICLYIGPKQHLGKLPT